MNIDRFSPREFLRARRPERFSDSIVEEQAGLDRSVLEYHLDTLTSRSQEVKFAIFARHLAEREICPNLLPQTGPTGGGDSKVDSETYPVADSLSLGWHEGIGREAASERWAFAFSAKKKWQEKVRSDVAKAVQTGRGYRKAFFVSSQFIRDRARAEMEAELHAKHGLDEVRIFDRTWILDKVFGNGREALAIEDLELETSIRKLVRKGPLDTRRENDLREAEERIKVALREGRFGFQLAEDCIEAADLARQLERPRTEIDGLFDRAERMACKCGTEHQRLKCAYQRAWTAFWWHEDYEEFVRLYRTVEERAKGSRNAYDLELLTNVWTLLHSAVVRRHVDETSTAYQEHTETLTRELERLSQEVDQPSAALQAQTLLLQVQLSLTITSKGAVDRVLLDLRDVVCKCEGLAGYPLEPLAKIVTELGEILHGVPAYEQLFETIVKITSSRKGEISAARMLMEHGRQQLQGDRPYDAIRTLGLALRRLYKHESRHESVRALYLCGCAYERVGLLWAARGTLLAAASLATGEYWSYGDVTPAQAACYRRLKWLELQLGRLRQILAWHEADTGVRRVLIEKGGDKSLLCRGDMEFDLTVGILLLKTDLWELKRLSKLPDVLEGLGLLRASIALIYALGHEEELRGSDGPGVLADEEDPHAFFLKWRDQPASEDLPAEPLLYEERKVTLRSNVLGCNITVECQNASPCVELAESFLGALESLLSTGTVEWMVSREPVLTVAVRKSDFAKRPFEFELQDQTGRPHVNIACCVFDPDRMPMEAQQEIKEGLLELLATIIPRIVIADDVLQVLEKLFREELALDRSLSFTGSFVAVGNVLGYTPKSQISAWSDPQAREYPVKRSEAWDAHDVRAEKAPGPGAGGSLLTPGVGEPPQDLVDRGRTKHTQIQIVSLIRETLWEKGHWVGTAFATSPDESSPPILAPVFEDSEAAQQIFGHWRNELGMPGAEERLRIAIVQGINKAEPYSYRVVIGSNPEPALSRADTRFVVNVSRINTMHPDDPQNLERFLRSYKKFGSYFLVPGFTTGGAFKLMRDPYLIRRDLHAREAWEIGRNDPDSIAIDENESPIIPPGQENAPVLELLRWKRERSAIRPSSVRRPKQKIRRNDPCPCGSGKKYKKCHGGQASSG